MMQVIAMKLLTEDDNEQVDLIEAKQRFSAELEEVVERFRERENVHFYVKFGLVSVEQPNGVVLEMNN